MPGELTVITAYGRVRGLDAGGCARFLGVPYGASTVGPNRFKAPQPPTSWEGELDATAFGPSAPQIEPRVAVPEAAHLLTLLYPRGGSPTEGGVTSEDCLRLNIWSPDVSGTAPVMVWLHGGAFQHGSPNEMAFNGDLLAAREDVVVVNVGHRLGLLGFAPLEGLGDGFDGSGVAGMLDIVQALEWVRDNISAFGGDPSNVTVFGQSGGGMKVGCLMAMPSAEGLFHRAIMQSGPVLRVASQADAEQTAAKILDESGLTDAAGLRDLSIDDIFRLQAAVEGEWMTSGNLLDLSRPLPIGPSQHPVYLPGQLFAEGAPAFAASVPLLIGSTSHDMAMMLLGTPMHADLDDELLCTLMDRQMHGLGTPIVKQYRALFPDEPTPLLSARIATDGTFRGGSYIVADAKSKQDAPVFGYLFDEPTDVLGGLLGACHSLDIAYVFGTTRRIPMAGAEGGNLAVADCVMRTWATFARTGRPDHDALPSWPVWAEGREVMVLGGHDHATTADACALAPLSAAQLTAEH